MVNAPGTPLVVDPKLNAAAKGVEEKAEPQAPSQLKGEDVTGPPVDDMPGSDPG